MQRKFTIELYLEPNEETFSDNDYPTTGQDLEMSVQEVLEAALEHGHAPWFKSVSVEHIEEVG